MTYDSNEYPATGVNSTLVFYSYWEYSESIRNYWLKVKQIVYVDYMTLLVEYSFQFIFS
jgi:hypothetical protein